MPLLGIVVGFAERVKEAAIEESVTRTASKGMVSPKDVKLPSFSTKLPVKVRKFVAMLGAGIPLGLSCCGCPALS